MCGIQVSVARSQGKPAETTIITPVGWVAQKSSSGLDQYIPLESAKQGRPGNVNCTTLSVDDPETRLLQQDAIDRGVEYSANRILQGLGGSVNGVSGALVVDQETKIKVSDLNAVLVIGRMTAVVGGATVVGHQAYVFLGTPGWERVATCTAGALTQKDADAAWEAWRPTLLEIVQSFKVAN
jgi:hypothetical protein